MNIFRYFLLLQVINISLKADNLVGWNWVVTFWALYCLVVISILYTIGILILLLSNFRSFERYQVVGLGWLFSIVGGFTVWAVLVVRKVIYEMDYDAAPI